MTDYEELDAQLRTWLAEDEAAALKPWDIDWQLIEHPDPLGVRRFISSSDHGTPLILDVEDEGTAEFCMHFQPRRMLADIAGKRALLNHVAEWPHEYVDGDTWFSCSQAIGPHDADEVPGSGCADEDRAGEPCDCHLDDRRLAVLRCVTAGFVGRPEFKPEWRIDV